MELGISNGNSGLYRNDDGASYPYNIGSIMTITGNSAGESGYYYFYYNIEVEVPCVNTSTQVNDNLISKRKLIKIVDLLGRESTQTSNKVLFYHYNDGTIIKNIIID